MNKEINIKSLETLEVEDMEKVLDHNVTLHHPNGVLEAKITNVKKGKKREGVPGRDQPFSIIFECDEHAEPQQALVMIRHEEFVMENVLVTPVLKSEEDQEKPKIYFQAVFG